MTIRLRASVRGGKLELERPVDLPDGETVDVLIQSSDSTEADDWRAIGTERLEEEWDNSKDAAYDDWRKLYGV